MLVDPGPMLATESSAGSSDDVSATLLVPAAGGIVCGTEAALEEVWEWVLLRLFCNTQLLSSSYLSCSSSL